MHRCSTPWEQSDRRCRAKGTNLFSDYTQQLAVASCMAAGIRRFWRKPKQMAWQGRAARGALSDPAAQVSALQAEAAKLRDEAQALEEAKAAAGERKRQSIFDDCDLDRSGGLNKEELRQCMQAHFGVKLDEDSTTYIFKIFDENNSGELELHEFNGEAIQEKLQEHMRMKEMEASRQQEQKTIAESSSKEAEGSSKPVRTWEDVLAEGNQDDNVPVRIGSVLAYLLPLCDAILFGLPVVLLVPQLLSVLMPFMAIQQFVNSIPLGVLIWFFTMSVLSRDSRTPGLLRFNLRQAIRLDIRICLLKFLFEILVPLLQSFAPLTEETINKGLVQVAPTAVATTLFPPFMAVATLGFLFLMALIVFGVAYSIAGEVPKSIPLMSEKIANFLGLHCSSSNADAL
eukprot:CAMPEP_0172695360 /NCGR_PEP_ID=MMETSP1074-20121228/27303_1 /TAXON_ID=2916 /ORGANISM="Ceratium fusus, Strain PA161109" /LENGTH=399 /DNA_ID=CAMNT_0013515973 /DNA_START=124 /DNA_END=1323 /DNA_ORIENTATION=-